MRPEEIWEGQTPKQRTIRALLTPLAALYAFGWQVYLGIYAIGFKRAKQPHPHILCVGSLLVGGSGKSPLTIHLAKILQQMGKTVVIGSSGYGAPHSEGASLAPPGPLHAGEWGDEPAMFRWLLPDVPQVVGRRRVLAAELVNQTYPNAILLMDDGFQHLPLKKSLQLLIDDGDGKNRRCLPAGPYREPYRNRRRADAVIPDDFQTVRESMRVVDITGESMIPTEYGVLCALGQPERFISALASHFPNQLLEPPVVKLQDHDPLTATDLFEHFPKELPIVVTAKDWVKLRSRSDIETRRILIALQEVRLEPSEKVQNWIHSNFDE